MSDNTTDPTGTNDPVNRAIGPEFIEKRLEAAIELSDLGVWDLDLQTGMTIRSRRHDQMWGYTEPQPVWTVEIALKQVVLEDRPLLTGAIECALRTGKYEHENRVIWPDGSIHWIKVQGRTLYDENGKPTHLTGVVADITERKQAEADIRKHEDQLRVLLESMAQLAWIAKPDGHIFWYNRGWLEYTGTTLKEMEGWGWQTVHDPQELPRVLEAWQSSIATGNRFEMTFPIRGADGIFRQFLTRVVPLKNDLGEVVNWFGTNTDVDELVRMEDRLRRANDALLEVDRKKDEFLATLAHELRNPLAPIRSGLDMLHVTGPEQQELFTDMISMMDRQLRHLVTMVNDLMDVSRIKTGKITLRKQPEEIDSMVLEAVETVRPLYKDRNKQIQVKLPKEKGFVIADRTRIIQVISNLLNNACKFSDRDEEIELVVEIEEGYAVFRIKDKGIGIAPDQILKVFDMFSQVKNPLQAMHNGLGIGLSLAKQMVDLHEGSIEVKSEGLGHGSEFITRLPLAKAAGGDGFSPN